jgi:hypothetical protein
MQDSAPAQFHEHEYIEDTESGCDHDEEVAGYDRLGVISYVRGETRMPSFSFNSLAMCSCPQVGFSWAI